MFVLLPVRGCPVGCSWGTHAALGLDVSPLLAWDLEGRGNDCSRVEAPCQCTETAVKERSKLLCPVWAQALKFVSRGLQEG